MPMNNLFIPLSNMQDYKINQWIENILFAPQDMKYKTILNEASKRMEEIIKEEETKYMERVKFIKASKEVRLMLKKRG